MQRDCDNTRIAWCREPKEQEEKLPPTLKFRVLSRNFKESARFLL